LIQPITKLVTISPIPQTELPYRLDSADGRFLLADRIHKDIDEWCQQAFDDGPRTHLGASIIGHECVRYCWYTFRWFKHKIFSGRMQRLFQDGHWYEDRLIQMLRGIGFTVEQVNEKGEQIRIYAVSGHFGGSSDGSATLPERYGLPDRFLMEFKTANKKWFADFHDVAHSKPQHWTQMCVYGLKRQIRYGIYFLVGKDNADLKIEVVELDWELAQRELNKGEWVILSSVAPARLSNDPSNWKCKMCDYHGVCHMSVKPDVNCRTCRHSQPVDDAGWRCNRWNIAIPGKEQALLACSSHEMLVD
jgi:hypothetical protein